ERAIAPGPSLAFLSCGPRRGPIGIPEAAADPAENVKTGPVRGRYRGRLGPGAGRNVGGQSPRSARIEAVHQRGADGLLKRLEAAAGGHAKGSRQVSGSCFRQGHAAKIRGAIFGLHKQAWHGNAKNIEAVLDPAADEPAIGGEGW